MGISIAPLCSLEMVIFFSPIIGISAIDYYAFFRRGRLIHFILSIFYYFHIYIIFSLHVFFATASLLPPQSPIFPALPSVFLPQYFFIPPYCYGLSLAFQLVFLQPPPLPSVPQYLPHLTLSACFFLFILPLIYFLFIYLFFFIISFFFYTIIIMPPFLPSVLFPYIPFLHHLTGS